MGNFDRQIGAVVAFAQVTTDGTAAGTTAVLNRGFGGTSTSTLTPTSGISRTGAGVYTCDYASQMTGGPTNAGMEVTELVTTVTCGGAAARIATRSYTTATRLTVRTFDAAGSAADSDFDVVVTRATNHEP